MVDPRRFRQRSVGLIDCPRWTLLLPLQSERPDQIVDVRASEIQAPRRVQDVPVGRFERLAQEPGLEATRRVLESERLSGPPPRVSRLGEDMNAFDAFGARPYAPDDGRFDRVRPPAHVAGPFRFLRGPERPPSA